MTSLSTNQLLRVALLSAASVAQTACSGSSLPSGGDEGLNNGSSGSSGSASGGASSGSSGSATSSSGASGTGGDGGSAVASCISACETKYPKGTQLGTGIDTCWSNSCGKECTGIGTGQVKPPAKGTCQNPVSTPSAACSQCTVDRCCKAWDACFDNADCAALNTCSIGCYR